jgi:glycogen debranching enzyme
MGSRSPFIACGHRFNEGCLGSIAEIFDAEAPHAWNGAPAQAWSVAEFERARLLTDL